MMVAQHHDIVARDLVAFAALLLWRRLDDDGRVHALLLLAAGMAVVPVGAGLADLETVGKGLAGLDAVEIHHGNAVHAGRHQDTVPMDGGLLPEAVDDVDRHLLALLPAQRRSRDLAVDGEYAARLALDLQIA